MLIEHSVLLGNYKTQRVKMLFLALVIAISVGGSFGDNDFECYVRENKCDSSVLEGDPPENAEELLYFCRSFGEYASCVAEAKEACSHDVKEIEMIRHAAGYLSTTCHADNPTFEAISDNLDCVLKVLNADVPKCLATFSRNSVEAMLEHVQPLIENERHDVLICLEQLMERGCKAMKFVHNCGERVGEAVEDILTNIRREPDTCTPESLEEIYPLLEGLGSIAREEMATWDKLKKRK